jgi:hypothetical protein
MWIGLRLKWEDWSGTYADTRWEDGSPLSSMGFVQPSVKRYFGVYPWARDEPNNYEMVAVSNSECVHIIDDPTKAESIGAWDDNPCSTRFPAVLCKKKVVVH